ncbi:hypothetical protein NL676_010126 [Syzygium grande]|nr:hypothetical protein NL676_010126 [Syzygium grande]
MEGNKHELPKIYNARSKNFSRRNNTRTSHACEPTIHLKQSAEAPFSDLRRNLMRIAAQNPKIRIHRRMQNSDQQRRGRRGGGTCTKSNGAGGKGSHRRRRFSGDGETRGAEIRASERGGLGNEREQGMEPGEETRNRFKKRWSERKTDSRGFSDDRRSNSPVGVVAFLGALGWSLPRPGPDRFTYGAGYLPLWDPSLKLEQVPVELQKRA